MEFTEAHKAGLCGSGMVSSIYASDEECSNAMVMLYGPNYADVKSADIGVEAYRQMQSGALVKDPVTGRMQSRLRPSVTSDQVKEALTGTKARGPQSNYDRWLEVMAPALAQAFGGPKAQTEEARRLAINSGARGIIAKDLALRGIEATQAEEMSTWLKANASHGSAVSGDVANGALVPLDGSLVMNAYTGLGQFPSALGGVLDIVLHGAGGKPDITFPRWSYQVTDAEDFRPQVLCAISGVQEFSLNMTGNLPTQANPTEESGLLYNSLYDQQIIWTPQMQSGGGGTLGLAINGLQHGHDLTLERMHANKLISSTSDLGFDGQVVFSDGTLGSYSPSARGNAIVSSGSGPTAAAIRDMRERAGNQVMNKLCSDGVSYQKFYPGAMSAILVGSYWAEEAYSACPQPSQGQTAFWPEPIHMPLIDDGPDKKLWYSTFGAAPFMAHVFQRGFGPKGRNTVWLNLLNGSLHCRKEGRFGVTVVHPQCGMVNYGS